jgi:hypothetical protein
LLKTLAPRKKLFVDTVVKTSAIPEGFGVLFNLMDPKIYRNRQIAPPRDFICYLSDLSRCAEPLKQRLTWPKRRLDGFSVQRSMYLSSTQGFDRAFTL